MSILIKGVDMPNSGQIELIIRPHGKVLSNTRGIYAEAIQIPKGHGRLIDADRFLQNFRPAEELPEDPYYMGAEDVLEDLRHTATILEAGE